MRFKNFKYLNCQMTWYLIEDLIVRTWTSILMEWPLLRLFIFKSENIPGIHWTIHQCWKGVAGL